MSGGAGGGAGRNDKSSRAGARGSGRSSPQLVTLVDEVGRDSDDDAEGDISINLIILFLFAGTNHIVKIEYV